MAVWTVSAFSYAGAAIADRTDDCPDFAAAMTRVREIRQMGHTAHVTVPPDASAEQMKAFTDLNAFVVRS